MVAVGVLLVGIGVYATLAWRSHYRFDEAEWKSVGRNLNCNDNRRQQMVGDLRADHLSKGMSVAETRSLLGPPSYVTRWPQPQWERDAKKEYRYNKAHSERLYGLSPSEYDDLFPLVTYPQEGVTLGWNTGRQASDCSAVEVYFTKGRLASVRNFG